MFEPIYLIIFFSLFFLFTFIHIFKSDIFFSGVYFFLYLYVIFSMIGYAYFPDISESLHVYFGPQVFYEFFYFIFLSFIIFYLCFLFFYKSLIRKTSYGVKQVNKKTTFFYLFLFLHLIYLLLFTIINYDNLDYSLSSKKGELFSGVNLPFSFFTIFFKLLPGINLLLYYLYRFKDPSTNSRENRYLVWIFLIEFIFFIAVSVKMGSRSDLVALIIAILVSEFSYRKVMLKLKLALPWGKIFLAFLLVLLANELASIRNPDQNKSELNGPLILQNDYYAPSHILVASIANNYIDPMKVLTSNLSNALVFINEPYLQLEVMDLFIPNVLINRSSSYAFYIFTEGYLVMGFYGFIYNGMLLFFGLFLWRKLANTPNNYFNIFVISLISLQMINIVRGQSSYLIKDVYMSFIPILFLMYLYTGLRHTLSPYRSLKK